MTLNAPPYCRTLTYVMAVLITSNLQTNFEMPGFIRSTDKAWAPKCRVVWPWPRPLGGQLVITRLILHVANSYTKFKALAVAVADIFQGCEILKCGTWPWPRPFVVSRLGLTTINVQTKFDVSNYTYYEYIKSGAKCINRGSLGGGERSLKVVGNIAVR